MACTVIAIDDDVGARRKLSLALRLEGFEVVVSDLLPPAGQRFAVGVVEVRIGGVSGVDHAQRLLNQGILGQVVFFTDVSAEAELGRARLLGPVVSKRAPAELMQILHDLGARMRTGVASVAPPALPAVGGAGLERPARLSGLGTPSEPPPSRPPASTRPRTPRSSGVFHQGSPSEQAVARQLRNAAEARQHLEEVFLKTRGRCAYCSTPLRLQAHARNVAGGWVETFWLTPAYFASAEDSVFDNNLWPGCMACAQEKGDLVARDYIARRLLAGLPVPEYWEGYDDLVLNSLVELEDTGTDIG